MSFFPAVPPSLNPTLIEAIQAAGLTTGLKLALDAGDTDSYSGSGQKWLDRSGGGYDFFHGTNSTSESADPTFNGPAGARTIAEYWGGDATARYFTYDAANETWMENLHKDNAIGAGLACIYAGTASPTGLTFFATMDPSNNTGFRWEMGAAGARKPSLYVSKTGNVAVLSSKLVDTAISQPGWHIIGFSVNEPAGAGGGFMYLDGGYAQVAASNTFDATYSAPSTSASSNVAKIGEFGTGGGGGITTDTRVAWIAVWEGTARSKADFDTLYAIMRGRHNL